MTDDVFVRTAGPPPERRQALTELLRAPDAADLGRRAHHLTCEGAPDRFARWRDLPHVYEQHLLAAMIERHATGPWWAEGRGW